jgi:cyclopropane-fatty-acyl-phospholipid synthase
VAGSHRNSSSGRNTYRELRQLRANLPAITTILTAEQVRVWRLYLAGGALAFEQGRMGVDQILAVKPQGPRR